MSHCSWPVICREAKRQKLEELSQQLHVLENDIELVQLRSDAVGCLCCGLWPFTVTMPSWIPEVRRANRQQQLPIYLSCCGRFPRTAMS